MTGLDRKLAVELAKKMIADPWLQRQIIIELVKMDIIFRKKLFKLLAKWAEKRGISNLGNRTTLNVAISLFARKFKRAAMHLRLK